MSHLHTVTDSDSHFIVDPFTGVIQNLSGKDSIRQHSHNSERFTFELPRHIEGHDMSTCTAVEVHFINQDEKGSEKHAGLCVLDDLKVVTPEITDPDIEVEDSVTCSWLIDNNATKLAGSLRFQLCFACVENGETVYVWPSAVFDGMKVDPSIFTPEANPGILNLSFYIETDTAMYGYPMEIAKLYGARTEAVNAAMEGKKIVATHELTEETVVVNFDGNNFSLVYNGNEFNEMSGLLHFVG